jgi:hypothetical protein
VRSSSEDEADSSAEVPSLPVLLRPAGGGVVNREKDRKICIFFGEIRVSEFSWEEISQIGEIISRENNVSGLVFEGARFQLENSNRLILHLPSQLIHNGFPAIIEVVGRRDSAKQTT